MIRYFILLVFCSCLMQAQDSLSATTPVKAAEKDFTYKKLILPVSMIAAGTALKINSVQQNLQRNSRKALYKNFRTKVDNYIQYAPVVFIFSGNAMGFESKNAYSQMAANTLIASMITGGLVYIGKKSIRDMRPDHSARNSFPSGHSALSFTLATIQYLEYKDDNIWYACSGFVFASATALMRVANNRHWNGDILAGAGIGIGVALVVEHWNPFSKLAFQTADKKLSVISYPVADQKTFGLGVVMNIR